MAATLSVVPWAISCELSGQSSRHCFAPYVWIWCIASLDGESFLPEWQFDECTENFSKIDKTQRLAICTWDHFGRFSALFRCMKSQTIGDGELTKISEMHYGVQLNGTSDSIITTYSWSTLHINRPVQGPFELSLHVLRRG